MQKSPPLQEPAVAFTNVIGKDRGQGQNPPRSIAFANTSRFQAGMEARQRGWV